MKAGSALSVSPLKAGNSAWDSSLVDAASVLWGCPVLERQLLTSHTIRGVQQE